MPSALSLHSAMLLGQLRGPIRSILSGIKTLSQRRSIIRSAIRDENSLQRPVSTCAGRDITTLVKSVYHFGRGGGDRIQHPARNAKGIRRVHQIIFAGSPPQKFTAK